ncbi:MAG: phage portal protein [Planctomycetota bacterium]
MRADEPLTWSVDVVADPLAKSSPPKYHAPVIVERSLDGSGQPAEPIPAGSTILRRWEGAQTDRLNEAHWAGATGLPIDADLAIDLPNLRARAAHEYHNNPLIEGIVETHATDIVGPEGPTLEVLTDDDAFATHFESRWNEWTEICDHNAELHLDEILRIWVKSVWTCGPWLGQETNDETGSSFPAMMRLHDIHASRLDTPMHMSGDARVAFGVRRSRSGRPLKYYVSQPDTFGPHQIDTGRFEELDPEFVYHDYIRTESGQNVGYPLLASALSVIGDLRDYDQSVLDAAQLAADRSEWFVNLDPNGDKYEPEDSSKLEVKYKRKVTRAAPPGWDVRAHDAVHPTANYVEHRRERMAELGRCAAMPLMLIRLDSSDHNQSSARFDHQKYCWHIKSWQKWLRKKVLNRLARRLSRELVLARDLRRLPPDLRYGWNWTPPPQGDPVKERSAERMGLQNRTLTFAAACRAQNLQEEDVIASWARTLKRMIDAGFTREEAMSLIAAGPSRSGFGSREPNDSRSGNDPSNRPQSDRAQR